MRKYTLYLVLSVTLLQACKKSDFREPENKTQATSNNLSEKVRLWLDTEKSTNKKVGSAKITPNKDANIDLLKDNLVFGEARFEQINEKIKYLCIPIKDAVLEKKNLDRNATLVLLLNIDSMGNINAGGIVYFLPADGKKHTSFPQNTFRNMFSGKPVEIDGVYKMLTVTGRWESQFEIKDKKLVATGVVTNKNKSANSQRTASCLDWYLVHTDYHPDGTVEETWTYLGRTCDGECDNSGEYVMFCQNPDAGGGQWSRTSPRR